MTNNIVILPKPRRKPRPLRKTYSPTHPYVVERHDQDDGSITYEVWDHRPDHYRRLASLNEHNESLEFSDEGKRPPHCAKSDAELIAHALNFAHSYIGAKK